jgi:hypothetical protein
LVLDSDALIKLNKAGVLRLVVVVFDCVVSHAVYDEVVTRGQEKGYADAVQIAGSLADEVVVLGHPPVTAQGSFGIGEMSIMALLKDDPGFEVVTDDRQFLQLLELNAIPNHTTPAIVAALARLGHLDVASALRSLEDIRNVTRFETWQTARESILETKTND